VDLGIPNKSEISPMVNVFFIKNLVSE